MTSKHPNTSHSDLKAKEGNKQTDQISGDPAKVHSLTPMVYYKLCMVNFYFLENLFYTGWTREWKDNSQKVINLKIHMNVEMVLNFIVSFQPSQPVAFPQNKTQPPKPDQISKLTWF